MLHCGANLCHGTAVPTHDSANLAHSKVHSNGKYTDHNCGKVCKMVSFVSNKLFGLGVQMFQFDLVRF